MHINTEITTLYNAFLYDNSYILKEALLQIAEECFSSVFILSTVFLHTTMKQFF